MGSMRALRGVTQRGVSTGACGASLLKNIPFSETRKTKKKELEFLEQQIAEGKCMGELMADEH